jgi:thiamine biosynthesis lipoprotein
LVEPLLGSLDGVFSAHALGVRVEIALGAAEGLNRVALAEACFAEMRRLEGILSIWSQDGELARWNRAAVPAPLPVTEELAHAVDLALAFCERSAGAFDPTVAVVLRRLGFYDQRASPALAADERAALRELVGCSKVTLLRAPAPAPTALARHAAGVELDLSGMLKGYALDRVGLLLRQAGVQDAFLVAGSSSMLALGSPPAAPGAGWPVRVPGRGGGVETWLLRDEGLATSGRHAFEVRLDGGAASHIIDPASGLPSDSGAELAIFRAPTAAEADMAATALIAMGPAQAASWLSAMPLGPGRSARLMLDSQGSVLDL